MTRTVAISAAIIAAATIFAVPTASAQTPAYTIKDTIAVGAVNNPPFTLGFSFTANSNFSVQALGFFDSGQNGILESHPIGVFTESGTLLTSTTIPSGTAAPLINQFRYANISPVTLIAGQTYLIGALYTTNQELFFYPDQATGFVANPLITYNGARYVDGATLKAPIGIPSGSGGYFGPNMLLGPAAPEPGSLALLIPVLGIASTGLRQYRRRGRRSPQNP
jgi:hypothetical protein